LIQVDPTAGNNHAIRTVNQVEAKFIQLQATTTPASVLLQLLQLPCLKVICPFRAACLFEKGTKHRAGAQSAK